MVPGVYANATVTVSSSGCVSAVAAGTNVVQAVPGLCQVQTDGGGTATLPPLADDPCNLTSLPGGQLLTTLSIDGERGITVEGCGTPDDPIIVRGPELPEGAVGLSLNTCGYEFANGVVVDWTQPVTPARIVDGTGIDTTWDEATCTLTIRNTAPYTPATTDPTTSTAVERFGAFQQTNCSTSYPNAFVDGTFHFRGLPNTQYRLTLVASGTLSACSGSATDKTVTTDANGAVAEYLGGAASALRTPALYTVERLDTATWLHVGYWNS
jgi:hypothetical protein